MDKLKVEILKQELEKKEKGEYILGLFKQFKQAYGIKEKIEIDEYKEDFFNWIVSNYTSLSNYASFLKELVVDKKDLYIAELDKGYLDSVTPFLLKDGYKLLTISQYSDTLLQEDGVLRNKGLFELKNGILTFHHNNISELSNLSLFKENVGTVVTQLPLTEDLRRLELLEEIINQYDLIIGFYSKTYDKDLFERIEYLKRLKQELQKRTNATIECKNKCMWYTCTYAIKAYKKKQ